MSPSRNRQRVSKSKQEKAKKARSSTLILDVPVTPS